MLNKIPITNAIFTSNDIYLAPLTLITGDNNIGKTALIREIRKACINPYINMLWLNGKVNKSEIYSIVSKCLSQNTYILILNQPEQGLDTKSQTVLGEMLVDVISVNTKFQIIIETHSEHLFNGVRLGVRDSNLTRNHTVVNYLSKAKGGTSITPLYIEANGTFEEWPDGFMDETNKFLSNMFGL